jgi:uncharacterized membrane protein YeaQ/YmgE (transglycosylase-associated protein family)
MNERIEKYYDLESQKIDYQKKQLELHHKEQKRKGLIRLLIGAFLGTIVFVCIIMLFRSEVPAGNRDVLIALVSGLTGAFFGSVVSYYFGDSDSRPDLSKFETPAPNFNKKEQEMPVEELNTAVVIEEPKYEADLKKE